MTIDDLADQVAWLDQQLTDLRIQTTQPQSAREMLSTLELAEQVALLRAADRPEQWCTPEAMRILAGAWSDIPSRTLLIAAAKRVGIGPAQLAELAAHGKAHAGGHALTTIDVYDLLTTDYAARADVIADVLPAGCTLLAGNAKDGKSLLAYHLAACVASGKPFLGQFPVQQGEVLFFALEDGERRGQERIRNQAEQLGVDAEALRGQIHFLFWDAPKLGDGFEGALTQWLEEHPQTRLIIIDILEKIRPPRAEFSDLYRTGYASTAPLTRVAQERNVALLVVHHTNKNPHSDPRLLVSGPMSVLGGADNAWLLRRAYGETEAELIIAGRDIPEQEWALRFAAGLWSLEGTLSDCRMSRERREVLEVLQEERAGMRPYQLAQALGKKPQSMRSLLKKMRDDGHVALQEEGTYVALVAPPAWRDPATLHCQHASVAGVHGVVPDPACMQVSQVGTPGDGDEGMHAGDGGDVEDADDGDDGGHAGDGGDGGEAMHVGDGGEGMHAGDGDDAGEALHAMDGDSADEALHARDAPLGGALDDPDPFLEPEDYPPVPQVRDAAEADTAQMHTPAQACRDPDTPVQEGDFIYACLKDGSKTNATPWEVIELKTLPNGTQMVYGLTPQGKGSWWPLAHCQKVRDPHGAT